MTLTGLDAPALDRWLVEVRKVAALSGVAARDACDVLLWSVRESFERPTGQDSVPQDGWEGLSDAAYDAWVLAEDIGRLRETMGRVRAQLDAGTVDPWEAATLRRRADAVGHLAGPEARQAGAADIAAVQSEASVLAAGLDVATHRQALVAYGQKVIGNASSIPGIVGGIDRALAELRRLGALTAEDEATAGAGKARAVRYRSDRKLEEAEVAAAGGNLKKAERLRAEAAVMLRQDAQRAGLPQHEGEEPG